MDRPRLTHEETLDALPGYLLHDLEPGQLPALEAHLARCPECRAEHDRLALVLGELGTLAPPAEPPADLRRRVLAALDDQPATVPGVVPALHPVEPQVRAARPARLAALRRWPLLVAAAVILALLGPSAYLYHDLSQTRDRLTAVQAQTDAVREVLARPLATIPLIADNAPEAYGTLYVGASRREAVMLVDDLPPTPTDRIYQVWLVQNGTRTSAALFTVDHDRGAQVLIQAPQDLSAYQSMGITLEPGPRGSPGPTGPRVVGCPLNVPAG